MVTQLNYEIRRFKVTDELAQYREAYDKYQEELNQWWSKTHSGNAVANFFRSIWYVHSKPQEPDGHEAALNQEWSDDNKYAALGFVDGIAAINPELEVSHHWPTGGKGPKVFHLVLRGGQPDLVERIDGMLKTKFDARTIDYDCARCKD